MRGIGDKFAAVLACVAVLASSQLKIRTPSEFARKAGCILDHYLRRWKGPALAERLRSVH
jgi:hypothetical protein